MAPRMASMHNTLTMIRHLTVRGNFNRLPLKRRQLIVQAFLDFVEQRMSVLRKARHHAKIVAYVWRALKNGKPYVMEKEVKKVG